MRIRGRLVVLRKVGAGEARCTARTGEMSRSTEERRGAQRQRELVANLKVLDLWLKAE